VDERERAEVGTDVPSPSTLRPPDEPFVVPDLGEHPPARPGRRRVPRTVRVGLGVLLLLVLVYAGDLLTSRGDVPRGTVVAGVVVGGLDPAAAEASLRSALEARATAAVVVSAGDVTAELDPVSAGLGLDWPTTLAQAGAQPLNPWTRLTSLYSEREVPVVTSTDTAALAAAVQTLRAQTDRAAVEGALGFDGATPVPVSPAPGQTVDGPAATEVLAASWFGGQPVVLAVTELPVTVTPEGVAAALATVATPAVSAPFTVTGTAGATAVLDPVGIAAVLSFAPDGTGGLTPTVDVVAATAALAPQLAATETTATDATVRLAGGAPQVVPAVDGSAVDWPATLADPLTLLTATSRRVAAVYTASPAGFTTAQAKGLGITEVIGEFTTGGFGAASGVNIRRVAEEVQGAVVKPGETFSLNGYTGTRGTAQGYVESGIIFDGRAGTAVGGGISQFATTLYNAAYFAGMTDVQHREHSYYISRYPAAREATVFEGSIDLRFAVPTATGILVQTIGTSSDITVRIWGTRTVDVESVPGARTSPTSPSTVTLPAGPGCISSGGAPGFTTSDTRVIRSAATGAEISRRTRTVRYDPQPIVVCEAPAPAPPG
jgi:vancomycin resistance protein YoaR